MSHDFTTNWSALVLPEGQGENAFTAVPPRSDVVADCQPKRRNPKRTKLEQSLIALETPQERKARLLANHSPTFNVALPSAEANARTLNIAGRPLNSRSQ
jgi:hypothetical protein